jgi:uncharacterized protein (DUF1499 family)
MEGQHKTNSEQVDLINMLGKTFDKQTTLEQFNKLCESELIQADLNFLKEQFKIFMMEFDDDKEFEFYTNPGQKNTRIWAVRSVGSPSSSIVLGIETMPN